MADVQRMNQLASLLYLVAAAMLLTALAAWLKASHWFPLREVRIVGDVNHITREQIDLIVTRELKGNLFTQDIHRTRQQFAKLPWVQEVGVRRQWPGLIEVTLKEHTAFARWGDDALLSTQGVVFQAASDDKLPVFRGPPNSQALIMQRYRQITELLGPQGLHLQEIDLSPRGSWELTLDNGMVLALGREQELARLVRFQQAYQNLQEKAKRPLQYVDLRYTNGFAVRLAASTVEPPKK